MGGVVDSFRDELSHSVIIEHISQSRVFTEQYVQRTSWPGRFHLCQSRALQVLGRSEG